MDEEELTAHLEDESLRYTFDLGFALMSVVAGLALMVYFFATVRLSLLTWLYGGRGWITALAVLFLSMVAFFGGLALIARAYIDGIRGRLCSQIGRVLAFGGLVVYAATMIGGVVWLVRSMAG